MKLSILIPSTFDRLEMTRELVSYLNKQKVDGLEIMTLFDNKEMSIGAKRQKMLEDARGEYVVYIDSDDTVSSDYVDEIMKALELNTDCVGFEIECSGTKGKTASQSNKWAKWEDNVGGFDYVRTPYQKTPMKREIALAIGYKDKRYAEDVCFSDRLKKSGLIKTEVYIPKVLYFYQFKYQDPKIKYGIKR